MNSVIECSVMCRACMKVDGVLLPMYGDDMISKKNLPDKLADLAEIHIDKYDGLPTVLCAKCAYRTDAFYDFKHQVQATEKKLRKMFQSQNIAPKAEVAGNEKESDKDSDANDCSSVESRSSTSAKRSRRGARPRSREKIETEVKPVVEDDLRIEETRIADSLEPYDETETTILADDRSDENAELSDIQSFDNIFISDIREMMNEPRNDSENVKRQTSDEIDEILQSENVGYALLYIPTEESADVDASETSQTINPEDRSKTRHMEKISFEDEEPEMNEDETECSSEMISWNAETTGKWTSDVTYGTIENDDGESMEREKFNDEKSDNREKTNDDVDSDSDYFVDPRNNIFGSLNDTIMRIKEIKSNGDEINYQCTLCMKIYEKLTGVLTHTVDNHVPTSGPFYCVVCEKDCESHRDLRSHVKTHSGRFPYTCFICNKAYSMKRYLKRHMSCHTDFPRHRCPKCGERFNVKNELENHVRTHVNGGPPFACSQCPRMFNHKGNYKRHLISHLDPQGLHLPKYPCQICGKRFLNNRTLETHVRVHTGEKPFKCDVCNRSFSQQGNLLNHLRIHSNPRSYTCEVCGKRFNQRSTLRDHSLLHTGEKPYVCNVCEVAFTFSTALRRHMWTHASDKPFGCEMCNARFVGKYDMKRHMKTHNDRPKTKRRRNQSRNDEIVGSENLGNETSLESRISEDGQSIFVEHQVILAQDSDQLVRQEEAEKENVDALFNLIQYG